MKNAWHGVGVALLVGAALTSTSASAASQIGDYIGRALSGAESEGVLEGKMAADISTATHSTDPVFIRAKVIGVVPGREDCGRVSLVVRQRVPTRDGQQALWSQELEMDMCKNGQPPDTGPNLRRLPPDVQLQQQ